MKNNVLEIPQLDVASISDCRYLAIEGPIGVGKSTLARRLAETFNYQTLLEDADENPFLERFYQDQQSNALPTQLFFLFQRIRKLQALRQGDMFEQLRIADFLIDKDPLFARVTLDDDEYRLYQTVYDSVIVDLPRPDLVIYLQAPTEVLHERVRQRGNPVERPIDFNYLQQLNEAYTQFFYYYDDTPLLIVNATEINLAEGDGDFQNLVDYLQEGHKGRRYYNPQPLR